MKPTLADNTAQGVRDFIAAHFEYGTPRSPAYRAGFSAAVNKRVRLISADMPYTVGTESADAWLSGYDHGRVVYLDNVH